MVIEVTPVPHDIKDPGKPLVRTVAYEVNAAPVDHKFRYQFRVRVEWRGGGRWAIIHNGMCLNMDGEWDGPDLSYSLQNDVWLETHRFSRMEAIKLAQRAALEIWKQHEKEKEESNVL